MRLVTPHMVRATNMRMIICFMIFLPFCNPEVPAPPGFASRRILAIDKEILICQ
jgi:hypothetical protein